MIKLYFILLQGQQLSGNFFTFDSFSTFAGTTTITFVIANGIQKAFNYNPKWLALAIAIIVCEIAVFMTKQPVPGDYLIAVLNGFLVFNTAGGLTALPGQPNPDKHQNPTQEGIESTVVSNPIRKFFSSWF